MKIIPSATRAVPPVVCSLQDFLQEVLSITRDPSEITCYRGHDNISYKLSPSIFRQKSYRENEHVILRKLISVHPSEFNSDIAALDKLVRVQHYSLPTRLLDVTANPLVALYFACQPKKKRVYDKTKKTWKPSVEAAGQVISFHVKRTHARYFDSDTVSVLCNLASLSYDLKVQIDDGVTDIDKFNDETAIKRLRHFICGEKPAFLPEILPGDMRKFVYVEPKQNNRRIIAQAGAFIVYGLDEEMPAAGTDGIRVDRITIDEDRKASILRELDQIAINERTLFPELDRAANYLKRHL